jgi:hypothetical protein
MKKAINEKPKKKEKWKSPIITTGLFHRAGEKS